MYSVVHFSYNSVQCKPNEHAVPYSADRGSGVDFFTVSGFLGESGTLVKTKELAVRSQIINILWSRTIGQVQYTLLFGWLISSELS